MASFDERIVNGISVLSAIIDSGTFATAGEVLNMSPSGVSRSIARLEARLGIRLLERTMRSVSLTDEGRRFYEQVMPLLAGLEEAAASAAQGTTAVRGRLRVNLDPYFSRLILGPRLGAFLESYPQLRLELITTDHLGDLVAEGFDLAVRFGFPRASTLIARKLLDTRMLTIASPAYLERHGHPKDPHELTKGHHVCIQFRDPETGRPYPWEFHKGRKKLALETEFRRGEFTETGDRSYAYFANSVFDLALAHGWPDASLEYLSHSAWAMEHGIAALILARRVPREDSGLKLQKMIEFAIDFFIDSVVSGPAAHRGAARAAGVRDGSPSDTTAT